ncbi:hypothetical protein ID866_1539 [Astraeus odoratus]|nr:hypothetical protein ID866_1539 [Astraeus odoratus]
MPDRGLGRHILDPGDLSRQIGDADDPPIEDAFASPASNLTDSRNQPYPESQEPIPIQPLPVPRPRTSSPASPPVPPSPGAVASALHRTMLPASHSWHSDPALDPSFSPSPSSSDNNIYSNLTNYTFGESRPSPNASWIADSADPFEAVGPLVPLVHRTSPDNTPRPSISGHASPPLQNDCSHPSQAAGRPLATIPSASSSRSHSRSGTSADSSSTSHEFHAAGSGAEEHPYPAISTDRDLGLHRSHHGSVIPDDASQHTFGHGARQHGISSSSMSVSSSRPSSRTSFQSGLLSSDDEVEIGDFGGSVSPVTFARDLPDIDEDADLRPSYHPSFYGRRKSSLPMAIPGVPQDGSSRSREGSILTLRRQSRSLDHEYGTQPSDHPVVDVVAPKSEPVPRGYWHVLEVHNQDQEQAQQFPDAASQQSFDLQYIFQSKNSEGSIRSFRSSAQYSFVQAPGRTQTLEPSSSRMSAIAPFAVGPRRTSTATLGTVNSNEDTFSRHIRKNDESYNIIVNEWLYVCQDVDLSKKKRGQHGRSSSTVSLHTPNKDLKKLTRSMHVGQLEYWLCPNIGHFKVDRGILKPRPPDDSKGVQHRLNIRPVKDTKNGENLPSTLIHKHSRATAFSIFRSFTLNATGGQRQRHTHVNTQNGVMLAPRKVQEQYTSTKTTQQLITHGLLDDTLRSPRSNRKGMPNPPHRDSHDKDKRRVVEDGVKAATNKSKGKKKEKSGGSGGSIPKQSSSTGSQDSTTLATSSGGSVDAVALQVASAPLPSSSHAQLLPRAGATIDLPGPEIPPTPLSDTSQVPQSDADPAASAHPRERPRSIDSDEERLPARTPHPEAFGALDPNDIEHYRSKANRPNADSGTSFRTRFLRAFGVSPRAEGPSSSAGIYQPPWIITAGREMQEENDRLINDLDKSFKDVGLLHTQSHKPTSKSASKRKANSNILDHIPEDCLYMLLPLWVGEIDQQSAGPGWSEASTSTVAPPPITLPENRLYLLVWYVPWEDGKDKKSEQQQAHTKKSKALPYASDDSNGDAEMKAVYLSSFRVVARVVHYDDLRHSGVRAPSQGLAISGPAWEAMNDLVFPSGGQDQRMTDTVVCYCQGRHRGFMFYPHGLEQLGLCTVQRTAPVSDVDDTSESFSFTAIGKAAVEMIWLGCLAVTSFSV